MCSCVGYCLIKTIILIGLIVFLLWLTIRPNSILVEVQDANLLQFENSPPKTLKYNIALNVTIGNPNKNLRIKYEKIEAKAYYAKENFASTHIDSFEQKTKKKRVLYAQFKGQHEYIKLTIFDKDKNLNIFVDFEFKMRYKLWLLKTQLLEPKARCFLKDLSFNSQSTGKFRATKCLVFYWFHWKGIFI